MRACALFRLPVAGRVLMRGHCSGSRVLPAPVVLPVCCMYPGVWRALLARGRARCGAWLTAHPFPACVLTHGYFNGSRSPGSLSPSVCKVWRCSGSRFTRGGACSPRCGVCSGSLSPGTHPQHSRRARSPVGYLTSTAPACKAATGGRVCCSRCARCGACSLPPVALPALSLSTVG